VFPFAATTPLRLQRRQELTHVSAAGTSWGRLACHSKAFPGSLLATGPFSPTSKPKAARRNLKEFLFEKQAGEGSEQGSRVECSQRFSGAGMKVLVQAEGKRMN
jgi:hypothetical protein